MDETPDLPRWTRRKVLATANLAGLALLGTCDAVSRDAMSVETRATAPPDFDFLLGRWRVVHRSLRARSGGELEWVQSDGECVTRALLGGSANFDDHVIRAAGGEFRAFALRSYVAESRRWAIWWLDSRDPHRIDPPMLGTFESGTGVFHGEEVVDGRRMPVRFVWTNTQSAQPCWEQAYSRDGGATWDAHWIMEFSRNG